MGVALWIARFDPHGGEEWAQAADRWLSGEERVRATRFTDCGARTQHTVGRAMLRVMAAQATGQRPDEIAVAATGEGKPYLPDWPDLQVSVAHTGATVAVARVHGAALGVDVESGGRGSSRPYTLAARRFSESERRQFTRVPAAHAHTELLRYWTIKEAIGKALGCGVMPALAGVVLDAHPESMELVSVEGGPPADEWTVHQFTAPGGLELVAIAVAAPGITLEPVELLTPEQLCDESLGSVGTLVH